MKVRTPNAKSVVAVVAIGTLVACGTVGAPVPPETVGVTPTIERQKRLEVLDEKQREAAATAESARSQSEPISQGEIDLPPLQPVGTR
jgi:hypothetical protein